MPFSLRPDPRGPLRLWKQPEEGRAYCIGADTGGGKSSCDFCAAVVLAIDTGEQVATFHAHTEPLDFADVVYVLSRFYGSADGPAFLCLETNAHGLAVLEKIRNLGHTNLYTRQSWDAIERVFKTQIGWVTSVKTRPILVNRARDALGDPKIAIRDPILVKEMSTFIFNEVGKEEHIDGEHDDVLFAWMMALEARELLKEVRPQAVKEAAARVNPDAWAFERMNEIIEEHDAARMVYTGEDEDW